MSGRGVASLHVSEHVGRSKQHDLSCATTSQKIGGAIAVPSEGLVERDASTRRARCAPPLHESRGRASRVTHRGTVERARALAGGTHDSHDRCTSAAFRATRNPLSADDTAGPHRPRAADEVGIRNRSSTHLREGHRGPRRGDTATLPCRLARTPVSSASTTTARNEGKCATTYKGLRPSKRRPSPCCTGERGPSAERPAFRARRRA